MLALGQTTPVELNVTRGDSLNHKITCYDDSGAPAIPVQTVVYPLTGYTAEGEIKTNESTSAPIVVAFSCSIPTPANGILFAALTPAQVYALTPGTAYWYQIRIYTAGHAAVYTVGHGPLIIGKSTF